MFPLSDPPRQSGMYGWPGVQGDRNDTGWLAPAAPGTPACLLAALERFGRLGREIVLEPAIRLASNGVEIDWNAALAILGSAERIQAFSGDPSALFPTEWDAAGTPDVFVHCRQPPSSRIWRGRSQESPSTAPTISIEAWLPTALPPRWPRTAVSSTAKSSARIGCGSSKGASSWDTTDTRSPSRRRPAEG